MFELTDDGTLDTVVRCTECGQECRYNYDGGDVSEDEGPDSYDAFIEWCFEDANDSHDCVNNQIEEE